MVLAHHLVYFLQLYLTDLRGHRSEGLTKSKHFREIAACFV